MSRQATLAVAPAEWVRVELLWPVFGISKHAATNYRRNGAWTEGAHYKKDPANRYVYNTGRISEWLGS